MNTITISTAKDIVKLFATKQPKATLLFSGDTGIGKTRMATDASAELKIACQIMHPALEAEEEVGGFPDVGLGRILAAMTKLLANEKTGELSKEDITALIEKAVDTGDFISYKMPAFWRKIQKNERGIFLIDEPNRAPEPILQALFSLIEVGKRTLRDHTLGDGWLIVLCINPPNGYYQVRELAAAFKRRCFQFKVKFDLESWIAWASENGVDESIVTLGKATPEAIWMDPNQCEEEVPPTPAGWSEIDDCVKSGVIDLAEINSVITRTIISGKVGERPMMMYVKHVNEKLTRPVMAEEIFGKKGWTKKIQDRFFEQQEAGKNDRMAASVDDILRHLKTVEKEGDVTDEFGERLRKVLLDKRFLTVYRSSLLIGIVDSSELKKVSEQIASDAKLIKILEDEVRANEAHSNK